MNLAEKAPEGIRMRRKLLAHFSVFSNQEMRRFVVKKVSHVRSLTSHFEKQNGLTNFVVGG